jgi:MarR family transcriptional regulator, organic hydroperoxide resistance regulator
MDNTELIAEILEMQKQADKFLKPFAPEPWIGLNLSIAQVKSLFFIADRGKTNFKKLAEALGVTPPNITGIIDRLVEQGLVSRTENREDRRVMLLQATDKGQLLLTHLRERRLSQMKQVLSQMSSEELTSLSRGMFALVKAAESHKSEVLV